MGYQTAAQALAKEIARLERRVEKLKEEWKRLEDLGQVGQLRSESFAGQLGALQYELNRKREQYDKDKDSLAARSPDQPTSLYQSFTQ